jgi:outer membrane protein TolC
MSAAVAIGCASKSDRAYKIPQPKFQTASYLASEPMLRQESNGEELISELEDALQQSQRSESSATITPEPFPAMGIGVPRSATEMPSDFRDLTESEMLSIAMSSSPVLRPLGVRVLQNPESAVTVFDQAIASSDPFFGPQAALAEFDSQLSAGLNHQNNDRVFNNTVLGGDVQELTQDFSTANAGLQKRTRTGATISLGTVHLHDGNNRQANQFANYWETQYEAGIRQPLLQGGGIAFNEIAGPNARPGFNFSNGILIARLNVQATDADFEIHVRDFVRDLYRVYWDLQQQYARVERIQVAKELAYQTWQSVLAKRNANVAGGEANKEAQARARYYGFVVRLQNALVGDGGQSGLYATERNLRRIMGMPIVDQALLRPIDHAPQAQFAFDFESLASRAIEHRTELKRQSIRVQQEEYRLVAAKNFLLPQLDLISRYRVRGFGDDLTGGGQRFASAYRDLFSLDHQEWEFGVEMGVAAGRRQGHAAVRNASLQVRRERSVLLEQQRTVRHEVANAHAEVASAFAAMSVSQSQVDAATQRLAASQAQFAAGKLQIEFLLEAQQELLDAEIQLAANLSRHALALVNIGVVSGTLLQDVGIHIRRTCCETQLL